LNYYLVVLLKINMMYVKNVFRRIVSRGPVTISLAVVVSVLFVTGLVNAATTISENIVTAGTLEVDSTSNLKDAVDMDSTLNVDGVATIATLKVGSTGTQQTKILSGTCTVLVNRSAAASSTYAADCVVAGVVSGDRVFVQAATTTPYMLNAGFPIIGAGASSTAGYITIEYRNDTGDAVVPAATANFGSSTQYWIVR
jgi:hypothetical protein